jgi:hypothetical protein
MDTKETLEKTKEILEKAIEDVKKEQEWIILENMYVEKLRHAAAIAQTQPTTDGIIIDQTIWFKQTRRFERKAARAEVKIHQFEGRVIVILDSLRQRFPAWNQALFELEQKTKIYDKNILVRVSFIDGTIPKLLKQNKVDEIIVEADKVLEEGTTPLYILLQHLEKELRKNLNRNIVAEKISEEGLDERSEAILNRHPFFIVFHSTNDKESVNRVLRVRNMLPQYYMGRKLEYVFEVDYIWITHYGKISPFFGHAFFTPRSAKKIWDMYKGRSNLFTRGGLMTPDWIFSRMGNIRLMIDIKRGWGSDSAALDELIRIIESYHLENNVMIAGTSAWPLHYVKSKIQNVFTVLIIFKIPLLGIRTTLPLNRPWESYRKFGFLSTNKFSFVNCYCYSGNNSEKKIKKQVKFTNNEQKVFIEYIANTKEKLELLLKHGAGGAFTDVDPETIIQWFTSEPITK